MTLQSMLYGLVVALLIAAAAWFLDRGLRSLGRPTRWVWIMGLMAGAMAPFISRLFPAPAPSPGFGLPVGFLYGASAGAVANTTGSGAFLGALEGAVGILWILGSVLVVVILIGSSLRLHRQRRSWEPRTVIGEEVLLSEGLGPAVLGLFRPRIVLPSWVFSLANQELEMVLLHEQEHRRVHDPALLIAGLACTVLIPWNPVIWWMLRRLRLAVEGDCDARVLASGIPLKRYGRLLLEIASKGRGLPALAPALKEGNDTFLEMRLMMIKSTVQRHHVWTSILAVSFGLALIVVACQTSPPPGEDVTGTAAGISAAEVEELSSDPIAFRKRLGEAIEAGEMTREEAARKWEEAMARFRGDGGGGQ